MKSITIISAKEHHFKNFSEARQWGKLNLVKVYSDRETGGKGDIRISVKSIEKFLSEKAVKKSVNKDVHLSVLLVLPRILKSGIDAEQHVDYKKDKNGLRSPQNGVNSNVIIHFLYSVVQLKGSLYRVKMTVKEDITQCVAKKVYSYEAIEIELLAGQSGTPVGVPRNSNNSISVTKVMSFGNKNKNS